MFNVRLDGSGELIVSAAVPVQTGETCADSRLQVPLDSTYPQLMLKTGTGERKERGREGKGKGKGMRKIIKTVTLVMF